MKAKRKSHDTGLLKANWNTRIILALLFAALFAVPGESQITSTDVFYTIDLTDTCVDVIFKARGIEKAEDFKILEKDLGPMHVYQMLVATTDMLIEFEKREGIRPMPKIVATPTKYTPEDVKMLADMMLAEIQKILSVLNINDYYMYENHFQNKTPTDVFKKTLNVFVKLSALAGLKNITPAEVFSQMVRAVSDVKSILGNIDPARRYRIDVPASPPGITPAHVFEECLMIREDINNLRKHFYLNQIPVPEVREDQALRPADVFIQTQIIIAELNLLKMGTGTVSSTPLAIPVSDKKPGDVHQQAAMVRYLLSQVKRLQDMVEKSKLQITNYK